MEPHEHHSLEGLGRTHPSVFSSSPVSFTKRPFVTREQILAARKADLSEFLMRKHHTLFRTAGCSLYMASRKSLYIRKGFPGYTDFATGEHGNPIDFLTRHMGYSFPAAVMELSGPGVGTSTTPTMPPSRIPSAPIRLPEPAPRPYRRVYAYLLRRGLPGWLIRKLEDNGLLYQDLHHANAVFVNPQRDYCELRGTLSFADRPFHGCLKAKPDRFWYYLSHQGKTEVSYVCESAIDALSLYLIHYVSGIHRPAAYISIGGVANQSTIDRIRSRIPTILAVDNDRAGALCRERNPGAAALIPAHKDWNEDLHFLKQTGGS